MAWTVSTTLLGYWRGELLVVCVQHYISIERAERYAAHCSTRT